MDKAEESASQDFDQFAQGRERPASEDSASQGLEQLTQGGKSPASEDSASQGLEQFAQGSERPASEDSASQGLEKFVEGSERPASEDSAVQGRERSVQGSERLASEDRVSQGNEQLSQGPETFASEETRSQGPNLLAEGTVASAPDEAVSEVRKQPAQGPGRPVSQTEQTQPKSSQAAKGNPGVVRCPKGHKLEIRDAADSRCTACAVAIMGSQSWTCTQCSYDICITCFESLVGRLAQLPHSQGQFSFWPGGTACEQNWQRARAKRDITTRWASVSLRDALGSRTTRKLPTQRRRAPVHVLVPRTESVLCEGIWVSREDGELRGEVTSGSLTWPDGDSTPLLQYGTDGRAVTMSLEGRAHTAVISNDGSCLRWSDGDVWLRADETYHRLRDYTSSTGPTDSRTRWQRSRPLHSCKRAGNYMLLPSSFGSVAAYQRATREEFSQLGN